ncbi:hypothetical protein GHV40_04495 [Devosia sp. D6-9]|nr:hypothetical protein GHV40_04495 [Devosia sp. D6-9]
MGFSVALFDLIAPYILRGEPVGSLHAILSVIYVHEYEIAFAEDGIVLRGRAKYSGDIGIDPPFFDPLTGSFGFGGNASNQEGHPRSEPARTAPFIEFADNEIEFSLTAPRDASAVINNAVAGLAGDNTFAPSAAVLNAIDATPIDGLASDAPSTAFTLDLLFKGPTLVVPGLRGAQLDSAGILIPDPDKPRVRLILPRIKVQLRQGPEQNGAAPLVAQLLSVGASGLDDPGDLAVAEMVRMDPPYAFIGPGESFGFGFRTAILDLSDASTPPDVLAQFGFDESWTGLYLPEIRLFVAPPGLDDFAVTAGASNLLIGIGADHGITGDFMLAVLDTGGAPIELGARFFDSAGNAYGLTRSTPPGSNPAAATATVPEKTMMVVDLRGGRAPYDVQIAVDGQNPAPAKHIQLDLAGVAQRRVRITVRDARQDTPVETLDIVVTLRQPRYVVVGSSTTTITTIEQAKIAAQSAQRGGAPAPDVQFSILTQGESDVVLSLSPSSAATQWTVGGQPMPVGATLRVPLAAGATADVAAKRDATTQASKTEPIYFRFDKPPKGTGPDYGINAENTHTEPAISSAEEAPWSGGTQAMDVLAPLVAGTAGPITIDGYASYDGKQGPMGPGETYASYNLQLSQRRADAVKALIAKNTSFAIGNIATVPHGFAEAQGGPTDDATRRNWWRADVTFPAVSIPGITATARIERPVRTDTLQQVTLEEVRDPEPARPDPPRFLRALGVKVRIVRDELIAAELYGKLDFETTLETYLREGTPKPELRRLDQNPGDGLTDLRIIWQEDPSTKTRSSIASIGADPADRDGLWMTGTLPGEPLIDGDGGRNALGAMTMFTPVLATGARPLPDGAVEDLVLSGATAALNALAALSGTGANDVLNFERVVLYGVELATRNRDGRLESSLLFDVETAMSIDLKLGGFRLLRVPRTNPITARYKALGVRLSTAKNEQPFSFRPVFDSSRGYTIDIGRPGAIELAEPLGKIMKVLGARVARTNPLSFEIDVGLAIDLGVVSIDRVAVRLRLDPWADPEITAFGVGVDIPGAFKGSGFLSLGHTADGHSTMSGALDLTLVPLRLRIAAKIKIEQFTADDGETKTGVLTTIEVNFPVGIPLGNSGLGIFGFLGLLGVNFTRTEDQFAGDPTPALAWLRATGGDPTNIDFWRAADKHWAFGVGAVLGTMEGGFLFNLKGMLILELPGPRLLLMMKANILIPKLPVKGTAEAMLLAVIDLDLGRGLMTVGVVAEFKVSPLLEVRIPTEAFFDFTDIQNWHVFLGRYSDRIQASVFEVFDGSAYLMVSGKQLPATEIPTDLITSGARIPDGFTVVTGLHASITWGSRSLRLYARVSAGADALLGFDPFYLAGSIYLRGELRLFVVSIEAYAKLKAFVGKIDNDADPSTPDVNIARIEGEICGKVELLFFDVEGCVEFTLGEKPGDGPPPSLMRGVSLVNRTAARVVGTVDTMPVDGIIAEASSSPDTAPVVPIDAIPVLLMSATPTVAAGQTLFFGKIDQGPMGTPMDGFVSRSDKRYKYELSSVELVGPLTEGDTPAVWWKRVPNGTTPLTAELALLSVVPEAAPVAIERNELLDTRVEQMWGTICDEAAPPAPVLWTFENTPNGISPPGWLLRGEAWPDPSGTYRSGPADLLLDVNEAWRCGMPAFDALRGIIPAEVQGRGVACDHQNGDEIIVVGTRRPSGNAVITGHNRTTAPASGVLSFVELMSRLNSGQPVTRGELLGAVFDPGMAREAYPTDVRLCTSKALAAPMLDTGEVIALGNEKDKDQVYAAWEKLGFKPDELHNAIVLTPGPFEYGRLLLFVNYEAIKTNGLVIRSIMPDGEIYDERRPVESEAMPDTWTKTTSPWFREVDHALRFQEQLGREEYVGIVVDIKGAQKADRIIIGIDPRTRLRSYVRPFYLAVVEAQRASEFERQSYDDTTLDKQRSVVTTMVGADSAARALLLPDTLYEIKVTGSIYKEGTTDPIQPITESYFFRTVPGSEAPARLDPYMLCTLPHEGEKHVFGGGPIKIAFSHNNVQKLYATYGKRLQVRFKASSYRQPEVPQGVGHPFLLTPQALQTVAGSVLTPFDATFNALANQTGSPIIGGWPLGGRLLEAGRPLGRIKRKRRLPCVPSDGYRYEHQIAEIPIPLDPYTDYLMDVELVDIDAPPDARGPFVLRRSFSTGRYKDVGDLAGDLLGTRPEQRFAKPGRIAALVAGFAGRQPQGGEFEDALAAAELPRRKPGDATRCTIFWEATAGGGPAVPSGIMIEAPEPLYRDWLLPVEVTDPEPDPITRVELRPRRWLEIVKPQGSEAFVGDIVADQDGRRVIAALLPAARDQLVGLSLRRIALNESYLDGAAATDAYHSIFSVALDHAPWEED